MSLLVAENRHLEAADDAGIARKQQGNVSLHVHAPSTK